MPTKTGKKKSAWSAKDIYDMFVKSYGFTNIKSREIRKAEADKYTIPYIPEKEIMLTTGRYNTGKISTNVLDSIYNAAKRTNVPVDIALGLAGRESTLGVGRGFKRGQSISGTDLMSNWQQIQPVVYKNSERNRWNETVRKEKSGQQLNEQDYLDRLDFLIKNQDAIESTKALNENPIDNALKLYQSGKYNPGDKRHTQMVEEDAKVLMSDPAIQKWLKTKTGTQMKCGGRRKAQLGLDIREGGIAIPIANNMFYINGRKHAAGGVAIGPNNKNGVEVEGGEVVEMIDSNHPSVGRQFKAGGQQQTMRVFSSVPFLQGVSPAQLVMGGANPDAVFKAQEEFKDRNRINDDGTIYQTGGQKKSNSAIRTEADKKVPAYNRAVYSLVNPTMAYPTKKEAVGYAIGAGIKAMRNPNDMVYWVTDSVSDAAWRKRHGLSYDDKFLIPNEDGSVRLPKDREMEIPTDTTMLKNRIAANKKLAKRYPEGSEKRDIVDWALRVDGMALDSLRHTYRTGEPVTINEGAYNSRRLINNGELSYPEIMPHNVMQNYAIQYDKSKDKMNYWDTYNFNQFEWGVPGKPFEIKGSVPLKKLGGNMIYTINGNVKNGLMSARPKAQYGKEKKINNDTKIGEDGLIYKRGIDGNWWTDGTTYEDSKYYMGRKSAQAYSREKFKHPAKPQSLDEVVVTGTRPKVKEESKPITTSSNNKDVITTQTIEGKQVEHPKNKTSYKPFTYKKDKDGKLVKVYDEDKQYTNSYVRPNREGANYKPSKYNPLTGETIDERGIVETSEPSLKGTSKVNSKSTSTPRGRGTKSSTPKVASQSTPTIQDTVNKITMDAWKASKTPKIDLTKVEMPKFDISRLESKKTKEDKDKLNTPSTGGGTQSKDERLIPQFKPINTSDWIGLGSNLAGHIASYFINNNLLKKYPMPIKPVPFQTAKLKTTHNINPQLTSSRETEQMNLAEVGRNTASSNTSIARKQRIMNEARDARNKLYGQKENIETQLINVDRRNRQDVYNRNIAAYNDWLDKTYIAKTNKMLDKQRNIMHMISGIPSAVNYMLGNIETRKSTNNTMYAIAVANPNVDGRLLGIGDYYVGEKTKKKYDKFSNLIG